MARELGNKVLRLLFSYDWEVVEIFGALFKLTWGFWLLLPFRSFRTIQGYNYLADENIWGWALFIIGLIHFSAIASDNRALRRGLCMFAVCFWIFTVVLVAIQLPTSAIIPMFSVVAFFMAINYYRLGVDTTLGERVEDVGNPDGSPDRRVK